MPPEAPVAAPSRAQQLLRRLAEPGALLGGRYRPQDILGQGGMGLVVHAVDTKLGRDVAIKWLLPELARDPVLVARFASEATALARIHHPNVVQILDVADTDAGAAYYVMEFVPGVPLTRRLREGPLPWAEAYDVLLQTAQALAAVHNAGLVHRDVKPSNLLCLETAPQTWHVKVIDFGIARTVGAPRLTQPGEMLGTLPYMAPEQFAGLEGDRRTDVYGWGVLALELLGRVAPVTLFGPEDLAGAPLRDAAAGVLERASVQPRIAAIVRGCLACAPDDRWPDMDEVTARLRALDDGGVPTLVYQRARPTPQGDTAVPGSDRSPVERAASEIGETADDHPAPPRPSGEIAATHEQLPPAAPDTRRDASPARAAHARDRGRRGVWSGARWLLAVGVVASIASVIGVRAVRVTPTVLDAGALDGWPAPRPVDVAPTPARLIEAVREDPRVDLAPTLEAPRPPPVPARAAAPEGTPASRPRSPVRPAPKPSTSEVTQDQGDPPAAAAPPDRPPPPRERNFGLKDPFG